MRRDRGSRLPHTGWDTRWVPLDEDAYVIDTGVGELVRDPDNPSGWFLIVNGLESSYVDLSDPTWLEFEYMAWMGTTIDLIRPAGRPVRAVHLGGGGCTLARYVAATRPRSPQVVFEIDRELLRLVSYAFRAHAIDGVRFEVRDALEGVRALPPASCDVIIRDTFDGGEVPPHLVGGDLLEEAARCLVPDGVYLANVPAEADLEAAEAKAAQATSRFAHVAMLVDPGHLRGEHFGNVVLAASHHPLPLPALAARLSRAKAPARVVAVSDHR